jgi:hypothetical protein
MKQNIGNADRIIRVVLGLVLIALGVYFGSWWGAIGLIPLITAAIGWCPLYAPFGLTTKSTKQ